MKEEPSSGGGSVYLLQEAVFLKHVHKASTRIRGIETWLEYMSHQLEGGLKVSKLREYLESVDVQSLTEMNSNSQANIACSSLNQKNPSPSPLLMKKRG